MPRQRSPHGTYPAYQRHLREKSPICAPCRQAQAAHDKNRSNSSESRTTRARKKATVTTPAKLPELPPIPRDTDGIISRLEILREMLDISRKTVQHLAANESSRLYLLLREQRDIIREISELQGNGQVKGVTLADQLADARAKRAATA